MTEQRREPVTHDIKCWKVFFDEMLADRRTFDVRWDDRGYQVGDVLFEREFIADNEPALERDHLGPERLTKTFRNGTKVGGTYTGRTLRMRVLHIMRGPQLGLARGWVIMGVSRIG